MGPPELSNVANIENAEKRNNASGETNLARAP